MLLIVHFSFSLVSLRLALLQVLLETGGLRDRLAGVLVHLGFRIAGVVHAAGPLLGLFAEDGSDRCAVEGNRGGRHEGLCGANEKGSEEEQFLWCVCGAGGRRIACACVYGCVQKINAVATIDRVDNVGQRRRK
jgi:hypothetical protein